MGKSKADQIVINQVGHEIEKATRLYEAEDSHTLPLAWFIAERLASFGFIRSETEMRWHESHQDDEE